MSDSINDTNVTFAEHKEQSAKDCEQIAASLNELAKNIRAGNLKAFEKFWLAGGTEDGDAKIQQIREVVVLRFLHREERVA